MHIRALLDIKVISKLQHELTQFIVRYWKAGLLIPVIYRRKATRFFVYLLNCMGYQSVFKLAEFNFSIASIRSLRITWWKASNKQRLIKWQRTLYSAPLLLLNAPYKWTHFFIEKRKWWTSSLHNSWRKRKAKMKRRMVHFRFPRFTEPKVKRLAPPLSQ